jgi:hypothetical protein
MDAIVLRGRTVTLRLLSLADATALAMAASESRDQYVYTRVPDGAASAQRTRCNTEAKHLLLSHAFDVWQVHRVSLKTDERNARSRRAIERLGAMFEGVRRGDMPGQDGTVRSSAYYSIMRAEWPAVRKTLDDALGR